MADPYPTWPPPSSTLLVLSLMPTVYLGAFAPRRLKNPDILKLKFDKFLF